MISLRARLSWIAGAWLCCQLSLLAATPLSLVSHPSEAADPITCTCVHTGNAQCPMHHPAKPVSNCQCRGTNDPGAAAIGSMLGPTAVLASATTRLAPPPITQLPSYSIARLTVLVAPPDGPPPRA